MLSLHSQTKKKGNLDNLIITDNTHVQCSLAYKNRSFLVPPPRVSGRNSILTNIFPCVQEYFFTSALLFFVKKGGAIFL